MIKLSNQRQMNKINAMQIRNINIKKQKQISNDSFKYFDFEYFLSFDKILIIGDGDFSFTLSLIRYLNKMSLLKGKHVIASCYPNLWKLISISCDLGFILHEIETLSRGHCDILFDI